MPQRHPTRLAASLAAASVAVLALAVSPAAASAGVPDATGAPTPRHHSQTPTPRTLPRFGDRGPAVVTLQNALLNAGITLKGGADGFFGSATRSAIVAYQTANGLRPSGDLNETTAFLLGLVDSIQLPSRGQRGERIRSLQGALVTAGITVPGGIDGIFGNGTASAVTAFQSARGLAVTGVVDVRTAIALGIAPGSAPLSTTPTTAPTTISPATTSPATTVPAPSTTVAPTTPDTGTTPPTTAPAGVLASIGSSGQIVTGVQRALIAAGVAIRGGADGRFGPATEAAVKRFQTDLRLPATGRVDDTTAVMLGVRPSPTLPARGDRGELVRTLQSALVSAGITVPGGVDGVYGSGTARAVGAYQSAQGLTSTGVVDLRTALYLGLVTGSNPSTTVPDTTSTTPASPSTAAPGDPTPTTTPTTTPASGRAPAVVPQVFPMPGPCWFTDTWQAPRSGGRRHEGVDIIAKKGTPLYAVVDGTITRQFFDRPGSLGGNALRLTAADGTYFHYAHLDSFATGIAPGSTVTAGQLIGYVGSTGSSSTPHLHFEYHPYGGAAVNPFPIVKPLDACRNLSGTTTIPAAIPATTVPPA